MNSFSPSDAAVAGFRFIGRHPGVVGAWAAAFLAFQLLSTVLLILVGLPAINNMNANDIASSPATVMAMLTLLFAFFLTVGGGLAIYAITFAAAYRSQLGSADARFGYMRLGMDELRIAAVMVLCFALFVGCLFVVVFFTFLLAEVGRGLPILLRLPYMLVIGAGGAIACAYPFVRLSLAMPMTIAERHIRLFESWRPTRGHFWSLLGAYFLSAVLIFVLMVAVWCVVAVVAAAVILGAGGSLTSLSGLFREDTSSIAAYLSPPTLVATVLSALASGVTVAVLSAPVAEAYKQLAGPAPDEAARTAV